MYDTEILKYIIELLRQSKDIKWNNQKELFELLFAPIPYGNDIPLKRNKIKSTILKLFEDEIEFDKERFKQLFDNLKCDEYEEENKQKIIEFIHQEMAKYNIPLKSLNIPMLIREYPCKQQNETNYRTTFSNWQKEDENSNIGKEAAKKQLEINFDFSSDLWSKGEGIVKPILREKVQKFIIRRTKKVANIFEELRKEFHMQSNLTPTEREELQAIKQMNQLDFMEYIAPLYPLSDHRSQEFIQKIIPIMYDKGYYEQLLHDVFEELDLHILEDTHLKKIKAHILGSPAIGEYKKAFDLLSKIPESQEDLEVVDLKTEAISNLLRYQLIKKDLSKREQQILLETILGYYKSVFEHNDTFHYYPGINLAYIIAIIEIYYPSAKNKPPLPYTISEIYQKVKPSIRNEKYSKNPAEYYFSHITDIEFALLREMESANAQLQNFLDTQMDRSIVDSNIVNLERTRRQMQFFIDSVQALSDKTPQILTEMGKAIDTIDDFLNYIASDLI